MKKYLILIITLISINLPVLSTEVQTASIEHIDLSFEQAYELMMNNNNAIKAMVQSVKASDYERKAAIGQYFPKVMLNSTYIHFGNPIAVTTNVPGLGSLTTTLQEENLFTFGGAAVWNVFTGGKIIALNSAARAKLEATNEKFKETQNNLTVELVKRYYGLRLSRDIITVRKQVMTGMKKHLEDAKLLEKEGLIAKSERLHAQVAYTQAERDYKIAIRDSLIIEEGLKTLIKEDNVNLAGISVQPQSLLFIYEKEFTDLNSLKTQALENNPQIKQLKAKRKIAQAKYHSEAANYSPTVSLFAYDLAAAKDLSHQVPRWGIGGSVNLLLFDGLSRYNNLKAADCNRKLVDYEILDAQYNIESLVTKEYQELLKNKEIYESSSNSIESAKESLRTADLGFKEGFKTSLEVTDAQLMLSKVKIERLKSIYDYDTTLCELLKTLGNSKEILNYIKTSKTETF